MHRTLCTVTGCCSSIGLHPLLHLVERLLLDHFLCQLLGVDNEVAGFAVLDSGLLFELLALDGGLLYQVLPLVAGAP